MGQLVANAIQVLKTLNVAIVELPKCIDKDELLVEAEAAALNNLITSSKRMSYDPFKVVFSKQMTTKNKQNGVAALANGVKEPVMFVFFFGHHIVVAPPNVN